MINNGGEKNQTYFLPFLYKRSQIVDDGKFTIEFHTINTKEIIELEMLHLATSNKLIDLDNDH